MTCTMNTRKNSLVPEKIKKVCYQVIIKNIVFQMVRLKHLYQTIKVCSSVSELAIIPTADNGTVKNP